LGEGSVAAHPALGDRVEDGGPLGGVPARDAAGRSKRIDSSAVVEALSTVFGG
jgi:hypothetical protein